VTVSVDPSGLAAGTYYGLVQVNALGGANSPQVLTVFLQVLPVGAQVAGVVQPSHLVFTATTGGESPSSQVIQLYNIVSAAKSYSAQLSGDAGLSLITLPRNATLNPQHPTTVVVQPVTNALNAGVYNGALTLQFSDGIVGAVQVTVIVSDSGASTASSTASRPRPAGAAATCTPTQLFPALTTLGETFTVSAGWPTALAVNVKDDCGNAMQPTGSVTVSFSDGDPPLTLLSQGAGAWENTWATGNTAATGVTLKIHADNLHGVTGDAVVAGTLASQQQPPVFDASGISSAAVGQAFTALAPGSAISIYGSRLAESTAQPTSLPLPTQLVDTQVFVAGTTNGGTSTGLINLPLFYVSENQVNAVVPFEVGVNTQLQLLVQRGTTYSTPVQVNVAQAQPAMFSSTGLPGGAGLIYVYPLGGGPPYLISPNAPAHTGDTIVIYCTGLGAVNPGVADGAAPGSQSTTVNTAQLMVGEQSAQVAFAGLTPGFAGLYQVNAVLPSGSQTGANVPIILAIDGQVSPPITIPIE
jgi:adhesin/invasin